jgi:hypothetical protein
MVVRSSRNYLGKTFRHLYPEADLFSFITLLKPVKDQC